MPTFLSKVFSRKKSDDKGSSSNSKRASIHSLLEGKYENISPTVDSFAGANQNEKEKPKVTAKDAGLEKEIRNEKATKRSPTDAVPHLTLSLPGLKGESRKDTVLGVVFEASPDTHALLDEKTIAEKRLTTIQALLLVKSCSQALATRDTLGIMHPHWPSESYATQQKLLSLFILSLDPKPAVSTLMPSPAAIVEAFETELKYTRSIHDITAVFRWGLRHLILENDTFGKEDRTPFAWYDSFTGSEGEHEYPRKAFNQYLRPTLPPSHFELLTATLDIIAALAARSEMNGTSGSKLSMLLGYYLLTGNKMSGLNHWRAYYDGWYQAGRVLEHLLLANIRDQSVNEKIPQRLLELVASYPYNGPSEAKNDGISNRPRFATRTLDALYVQIEIEMDADDVRPSQPTSLRLIEDAFKLSSQTQDSELQGIWEKIKTSASSESTADQNSPYSNVFTDESIRLLSLTQGEKGAEKDTSITMFSSPLLRRSASWMNSSNGATNGKLSANALGKAASTGTNETSSQLSPITADWDVFSQAGFGEDNSRELVKSLFDTDVEKTSPEPLPMSKKSGKKSKDVQYRGRRMSVDTTKPVAPKPPIQPKEVRCAVGPVMKLDETFVDFWSDSLLDPMASARPTFVVCQFKDALNLELDGKKLSYLVVEQTVRIREPPQPIPDIRSSSPRPSRRSEVGRPSSRVSSTFSATRKRFTLFGGSQENVSLVGKKVGKGVKTGELGELLTSESSTDLASVRSRDDRESLRNAHGYASNATTMTSVPEQEGEAGQLQRLSSVTEAVNNTVAAPLVSPSISSKDPPARPGYDTASSHASLPESAIVRQPDIISSSTQGRESRFIEQLQTPPTSKLPELTAEVVEENGPKTNGHEDLDVQVPVADDNAVTVSSETKENGGAGVESVENATSNTDADAHKEPPDLQITVEIGAALTPAVSIPTNDTQHTQGITDKVQSTPNGKSDETEERNGDQTLETTPETFNQKSKTELTETLIPESELTIAAQKAAESSSSTVQPEVHDYEDVVPATSQISTDSHTNIPGSKQHTTNISDLPKDLRGDPISDVSEQPGTIS